MFAQRLSSVTRLPEDIVWTFLLRRGFVAVLLGAANIVALGCPRRVETDIGELRSEDVRASVDVRETLTVCALRARCVVTCSWVVERRIKTTCDAVILR